MAEVRNVLSFEDLSQVLPELPGGPGTLRLGFVRAGVSLAQLEWSSVPIELP